MCASSACSAAPARCIARRKSARSWCPRRVSRRNSSFDAMCAAYLDWNATAPVRPEAAAAMAAALSATGNPSSVHRAGREARRVLNEARDAVAALVNARADEIVFTSGGSEANALALAGFPGRRLLISAIEHDSVRGNAAEAETIPVLADGRVDLDALDIDLMSLSAHKLGGPMGSGALAVRGGLALRPSLRGGGQERRLRAGTENLPGIAGFGAAARAAQVALETYA